MTPRLLALTRSRSPVYRRRLPLLLVPVVLAEPQIDGLIFGPVELHPPCASQPADVRREVPPLLQEFFLFRVAPRGHQAS